MYNKEAERVRGGEEQRSECARRRHGRPAGWGRLGRLDTDVAGAPSRVFSLCGTRMVRCGVCQRVVERIDSYTPDAQIMYTDKS